MASTSGSGNAPGRRIVECLVPNCCEVAGVLFSGVPLFSASGCESESGGVSPIPGWCVALCWRLVFGVPGASFDRFAKNALGKENGGKSSSLYGSGRGF